jgi:hypothetical protein
LRRFRQAPYTRPTHRRRIRCLTSSSIAS